MNKIDILLATYNGEKYIKSQIYSIISQEYQNWNLIIHDDGSTDNTVKIIKEFINFDKRIILIEDSIKFGKPGSNFLHLLKSSTSDYIMFCDQDDIWFDNKISIMFNEIKKKNSTIPTVIYSNSYSWNPNEGILGLATFNFPKNLKSFLFLNSGMQGCVAIFNKKMKEELMKWDTNCAMHDHILQLIGLSYGNVSYIHIPLMLYRQHINNVTGITHTNYANLSVFKRKNLPVVSLQHYIDISYFLENFRNKITKDNQKIINIYLNLRKSYFIIRFIKILYYGFKLHNSRIILLIKLITRPYIK